MANVYATPDEFSVILFKDGKVINSFNAETQDEALEIATKLVNRVR